MEELENPEKSRDKNHKNKKKFMEIKVWYGFHLMDPTISSEKIKGQMKKKFEFSFFNEEEEKTEIYDFSKLIEEDVKMLPSLLDEREDQKDFYFHDRIYVMRVDLSMGDFIRIIYGFEDKNDGTLREAMGQLYENAPVTMEEKIKFFPDTGRTKPQIYW